MEIMHMLQRSVGIGTITSICTGTGIVDEDASIVSR